MPPTGSAAINLNTLCPPFEVNCDPDGVRTKKVIAEDADPIFPDDVGFP